MTYNIVVGVDGSESSFVALAAAADLAEQTGSQLSVTFVHDPGTATALATTYDGGAEVYVEQSIEDLESTSRERTFDLLADRSLEWTFDVVRGGDAVHMLLDVAKRRAASLIVVGGRGHSVVGGLVLGSVAQKLVRCSPISVLVVRKPAVNLHQMAGQRTGAR
jgi:nucleotide-binding universal stress UspA family protein